MEFIEKRAKELYESNSGLSKPADQFGFGYPFLSYSDIFHNFYIPDKLTTLVNSTEKDRRSCSIKRGDVFLTRTSETTDELGMSCVALRDIPNATFNGFAKRLRPITDEIVPEYAAYYFRSGFFRAQCMSMASLITRASLNDSMIGRLRIRYPQAKSVQMRIGTILMNYDKLIENNNKRIKLLEQMAENLYKEWFVRFRFPRHESAEFVNGIPKGWEYRRADEIILFNPSLKTGKQTSFTIIPMEALSTSSMVLDSNCFVVQDTISGRRSQNGDTLLAKITPCLENGKTGFVMGMGEGEVCGGSTEFVVMRSKTLTPHYVYCIARSHYFRQTAILSMNGADGRQRVDEDKLKAMKILQPEADVLRRFEDFMSPLFDSVYHMVQKNRLLVRQRDLLLPRLMSGKLEV